eukprot:gene25317-1672_t
MSIFDVRHRKLIYSSPNLNQKKMRRDIYEHSIDEMGSLSGGGHDEAARQLQAQE